MADTKFKPGQVANPSGRPKGTPNKTTALLKDAILQAAERAGNKVSEDGQGGLISYLEQQAAANPGPFLSLLGKVLPMQVTGEDGGAIQVAFKTIYEQKPGRG